MKNIISKLKNKTVLRTIIFLILILLILGGSYYFEKKTNRVSIDNSIVSAPITVIAPSTPGTLKKIYVTEGQKVKKGDALASVGNETLHAYTAGIIISVNKQIGSTASSQTPVVQMINPTDMRIDGTIDENKGLNNVKIGQIVLFSIDALPGQKFWGYVDEIAPSAKQTQSAFSISSERPIQQFEVFANFDATNHPEIKNGMSSKMTIFTKN